VHGRVAGAEVSAAGTLEIADQEAASIDLTIRADAPHLQVFVPVARRDLPKIGPVSFSGVVKGGGAKLGLSELDVRIGTSATAWLNVTGFVRDLQARRHFSLHSEFGFTDARLLHPLVGNPPDVGSVSGTALFDDLDGTPGIDEFKLKGGRPDVFEIDAQGSFGDFRGIEGLDARVEVNAADLAVLGELLNRTLPPIGPLSFSGEVEGHHGEVVTHELRARLDKTHLQGSLSGSFGPGRRPRIKAQLKATELYLDDIGIELRRAADRGEPAESPGRRSPASSQSLFSDQPIDLAPLRQVDGQLSLSADRVVDESGAFLKNLQIEGNLEDGALSFRHSAFDFDGGKIEAAVDFDAGSTPPSAALRAQVRSILLARLLEQLDERKAYSGTLHANVDLKTHAHGADVREFLDLLGIEVKVDGSAIVLPILQAPGSSASAVHLETRSAYDVLNLVGAGIEIPPGHLEAGIVEPAMSAMPGRFITIHSSEDQWWRSRPQHATVAIPFRDNWFYIDATDTPSKRAFVFLRTLIGMRLADPTVHHTPVLTLPAN
jgi:hypothetical protein